MGAKSHSTSTSLGSKSNGATSTSTSAVISTLVMNMALWGAFTLGFLLLRVKFKRIYSPRASYKFVEPEKRPPELAVDPFSWIIKMLFRPHSQIIQYAGLDGYFFLRYILIMAMIFLGGCLTFIVLLPINAVGGRGELGFDQLSISNVSDSSRYWAHLFIGWAFYGTVIFIVYRELFYYNSVRAAALSTPRYARLIASRTVLFQNVPNSLLDEKQFFKLFHGVKKIYVVRNMRKLSSMVRKRAGLVRRLENSEVKLIKTAIKNKNKMEKKNMLIEDPQDINSYVPENKRPRQKSGGFFSKKIDTIEYCLEEIPKIDKEVRALQKAYRHNKPKNSLFVEFDSQYTAQLAFQTTIHHNPLRMMPVAIGSNPEDIVWGNLRIFWWELITRRVIAIAGVTVVIILWAVPVAFVGVISNLTYITNKLPWLRFVYKLPKVLLGLITGVLPTALLSLLFLILPMYIRGMAKVSGAATVQRIELFAQSSYFWFLFVNTFTVITIASSATSVITQIMEKPTSAMSLLSNNLPKASNFFISYIILQGFVISGSTLFQIVGFFLFYILGYLLDWSPRKKWMRWTGLDGMTWGTTFPLYTNLACITLAYSIISPMILIFAFMAFILVFLAYSYHLTYVCVPGPDIRGLHYPKALMQTFTGIYFGEVCLLGIFAVGKGWGPIVLQVISIGVTIFCHYNLGNSFERLVTVIPLDAMIPLDGVTDTPSFSGVTDYKYKVLDKRKAKRYTKDGEDLERHLDEEYSAEREIRQGLMKPDEGLWPHQTQEEVTPVLADRDFKTLESRNWIVQFLRPDVFASYRRAKDILPAIFNVEPEITEDKHAYDLPIVAQGLDTVWIPKDTVGLSTIEIENAKKVVNMTDDNAVINDKAKIFFTGPAP